MTLRGVGARLMDTFLAEMAVHVVTCDEDLGALERSPAGEQATARFESLCRTTHSLKGASQAVQLHLVEGACHWFEELLLALRASDEVSRQQHFALLFETVDALGDAHARLRQGQPLGGSPLDHLVPRLERIARKARDAADAGATPASVETPATLDYVDTARDAEANRLEEALAPAPVPTLFAPEPQAPPPSAALPATGAAAPQPSAAAAGLSFQEACEGIEKLVQDLSVTTGKKLVTEIVGGAVRLDPALATALQDPLRHLVRNAVDHGIEPNSKRTRARKPVPARIVLAIDGGEDDVLVSVLDDGRGLDMEAIRAAAARLGVPEPDSGPELVRLLCKPGFSTAPQVSTLSGRGAGLDAVRSRVETLGGTLGVAFTPGLGTRFEIRIPRPGQRMPLLLVTLGGVSYGLPVESVVRVVRIDPAELRWLGERAYLSVEGRPLPIAPLDQVLGETRPGAPSRPSSRPIAVVLSSGSAQAAVAVEGIGGIDLATLDRAASLRDARELVLGTALVSDGRSALALRATDVVARARQAEWPHGPTAAGTGAERAAPGHVLVASEGRWARDLLRRVVGRGGYKVSSAATTEEALRSLDAQTPDMVLAESDDLADSAIDAVTIARAARQVRRDRPVPTVLLRRAHHDPERDRGEESPFDRVITFSSFEGRTLLDTMARLLDHTGEPRP